MLVVAGRMSARYSGRIDAELSLGDCLLLWRDAASGGDGSVLLLDAAVGIQPRNWMPAGSEATRTKGGYLFQKGEEILEVFIDRVYWQQEFSASGKTTLRKLGAEREMADLLSGQLHVLYEKSSDQRLRDLRLEGREYRTVAGPIDILARNKNTSAVIELKRVGGRATHSDLYQLQRYMDALGHKRMVGVLVAPGATRSLMQSLEGQEQFIFIRLSYEDLL